MGKLAKRKSTNKANNGWADILAFAARSAHISEQLGILKRLVIASLRL